MRCDAGSLLVLRPMKTSFRRNCMTPPGKMFGMTPISTHSSWSLKPRPVRLKISMFRPTGRALRRLQKGASRRWGNIRSLPANGTAIMRRLRRMRTISPASVLFGHSWTAVWHAFPEKGSRMQLCCLHLAPNASTPIKESDDGQKGSRR